MARRARTSPGVAATSASITVSLPTPEGPTTAMSRPLMPRAP
jgi:hypothetical protein